MRWLVLRLRAPLASFGGEAIDARGVTRDFPASSALTGLLGNALGYERRDADLLDRLQARLVYGVRRNSEPPLGRMTDFQTAKIYENDSSWTTSGREGREKSPSYKKHDERGKWLTHIRYRDHHADVDLSVVLRLEPEDEAPTLGDLVDALDRPARPLFIGRKACLPAAYLNGGLVEAPSARAALMSLPANQGNCGSMRAIWPAEEGGEGADRIVDLTDQRNWRTGLHGGARRIAEGRIVPGETS